MRARQAGNSSRAFAGQCLLVEAAFAGHDQVAAACNVTAILHGHPVAASGGTVTTKAADYPGVYGTGYVVQTSTTLTGTWTNEPGSGNVTFSGNDVTYTFPSGPVRKFARLKVMSTP